MLTLAPLALGGIFAGTGGLLMHVASAGGLPMWQRLGAVWFVGMVLMGALGVY